MDIVENGGVGEVAVHGEGARDMPAVYPIHQVLEQLRMVLEGSVARLALLTLLEAAEVQGVMFARGADVVGDQVVVGNLVALRGVVPEPADVVNQLAGVVDQGVVQGNGAVVAVAGVGVFLQQVKPPLVEGLDVPGFVVDKAVEAGRVGGAGELGVDASDRLAGSDKQASQVLGEVAALRLIVEQVAEVLQGFLNHLREVYDAGHGSTSRRERMAPIVYTSPVSPTRTLNFARHQLPSGPLHRIPARAVRPGGPPQ